MLFALATTSVRFDVVYVGMEFAALSNTAVGKVATE